MSDLGSYRRLLKGLFAAGLVVAAACRAVEAPRITPVHPAAALALEEARLWMRRPGPEAIERARAAAERARERQPDWVAPRRVLDELLRADLLGVEALAQHRATIDAGAEDAATLYLAGRLEGRLGAPRFRRAVALDPDLAWGYHGLAWVAAGEGDLPLAMRYQRMALARARDGWERCTFSASLARFYAAADQPRQALDVLLERLDDPETGPIDLIELSIQAAQLELTLLFQPEARRGTERALELLRDNELTDLEVEELARDLLVYSADEGRRLDLQLALAARSSPARDRLRAEMLLRDRPTALALGLLQRAHEAEGRLPSSGPLMRAARFAAGQFKTGIEEWLTDLPHVVLDEQNLPRDARLARVVSEARALDGSSAALARLGAALVDAGWFDEARAVAAELAEEDLESALRLEAGGTAGQAELLALRRVIEDREGELTAALRESREPREPARNIAGLLAALAPDFARVHAELGGERDPEAVATELAASPLISFGFVGALVHPGPRFSAADEAEGRGREGEPVPGLAQELERINRFGVVGQVLGGGGPDGVILRRLHVEEQAGEHLGAPWSGTIAWCEGADVSSRVTRSGSVIAGAALHEGYWLDIDALRAEREAWAAFQRRVGSNGSAERFERALASRGLELRTPRVSESLRRTERRSVEALLGESERMRLALLRDRAKANECDLVSAPPVTLDELVAMTALHEQGHLCDRARFLPVRKHLGRVLGLFLSVGFSPRAMQQRLEYRAQLVALCTAPDPRLPWVEVLRVAEAMASSGGGLTAHGDAYVELLEDLMLVLDRELFYHPGRWPEIDPDHVLAHQLHLLGPERLRALALVLAERSGLGRR